MDYIKNQSFITLLTVAIALFGVVLIAWWFFTKPSFAPVTEESAEFQQTESEFDALEFDESQLDTEFNALEQDINAFEGEL